MEETPNTFLNRFLQNFQKKSIEELLGIPLEKIIKEFLVQLLKGLVDKIPEAASEVIPAEILEKVLTEFLIEILKKLLE